MPNHYTNICVCSPGYDFDVDSFLEAHAESDFCSIVRPMPEPLLEVNVGYKRLEDGSVVTQWRDDEKPIEQVHGYTNWRDWSEQKWGTKWGTYKTQAAKLGGDAQPVIISFQTAWSAPNDGCRADIAAWLKKTYGFERVVWIGFDPYDDSTAILQ